MKSNDEQQTLFNLHECLQDAVVTEPYGGFACPVHGDPARKAKDPTWLMDALMESLDGKVSGFAKRITASFLIDRPTMAHLHAICEQNGTTASAFLRQCARRLVLEYAPNDRG